MARRFNVTGPCMPARHYMVDTSERVSAIQKMVDNGFYFAINRARQYGKTTTLAALARELEQDYFVASLDFQDLGSASFQNENTFSLAFMQILLWEMKRCHAAKMTRLAEQMEKIQEILGEKDPKFDLMELSGQLFSICECSVKPVVLMIDEVDSASNNQVFLDFLGLLRSSYLKRETRGVAAFQSVILAGVYDVKNLKRKLRPSKEHKANSPWNIAADFNVDMSLPKDGIAGMLKEYETDHKTGMDVEEMAELLYDYTSGYPFLVSRLCKLMDESICSEIAWTKEGVLEAVRILLLENNTLFESIIGKLHDYPELEKMLGELLFSGKAITYNPMNPAVSLGIMFGFVKNEDGKVIPANRIFDTLLYNHFLSMDEMRSSDMFKASLYEKDGFIKDGRLDMQCILEKFVRHFHELYGNCKDTFLKEEGRRYFLLYLRPIINGTGNYYIEAHTRSLGRTDIIVDYGGEQFVIEIKIWRGNEYNLRGEHQLVRYLEDYGLDVGYMLSFNFNRNKQVGVHIRNMDGRKLVEAVV